MAGHVLGHIDQENNHNPNFKSKQKESNENIKLRVKDSRSLSSSSKLTRIPLGGKSQNGLFTLNRSQSSLTNKLSLETRQATALFQPPNLVKSNSTLGFGQSKPIVHTDIQHAFQMPLLQQTQQQLKQKEENELNLISRATKKRVRLEPLNEDLSYERVKRMRVDDLSNVTDSLLKQAIRGGLPVPDLPLTYSRITNQLHVSNRIEIADVNKNNVDPIKRTLHNKPIFTDAQLDRDIEYVPAVRETVKNYPIEPLNEEDLLFFSTPNKVRVVEQGECELSDTAQDNDIPEASAADLSIDMDFDDTMSNNPTSQRIQRFVPGEEEALKEEELGLSIDELKDLLD